MRRINSHDFSVAKQSTSREINKQIVLSLVREHQPISRADLARRMNVGRGVVTTLVSELIANQAIYEGAAAEATRGRKPISLYVRTHDRLVVAIDVRFSRTYMMLADFGGRQLALETLATPKTPATLIKELAKRVSRLLDTHNATHDCQGIGLVVPGIIDRRTGRILHAPTLGWRNVDIRTPLAARTGLPVHIENAPKACALAQMWLSSSSDAASANNFVYVSVSDGVGVGVVVGGELVRGHHNVAGEFGHIPLSLDGPRCTCGARGCWEAYISNLATVSRYFGRDATQMQTKTAFDAKQEFGIEDLIARMRSGDKQAEAAIQATGHYLGLGLATIINAVDPARIYIGGEITAVWDLIRATVQAAIVERAMTRHADPTLIHITPAIEYPRLRGATALVAAPTYAAPRVA